MEFNLFRGLFVKVVRERIQLSSRLSIDFQAMDQTIDSLKFDNLYEAWVSKVSSKFQNEWKFINLQSASSTSSRTISKSIWSEVF